MEHVPQLWCVDAQYQLSFTDCLVYCKTCVKKWMNATCTTYNYTVMLYSSRFSENRCSGNILLESKSHSHQWNRRLFVFSKKLKLKVKESCHCFYIRLLHWVGGTHQANLALGWWPSLHNKLSLLIHLHCQRIFLPSISIQLTELDYKLQPPTVSLSSLLHTCVATQPND